MILIMYGYLMTVFASNWTNSTDLKIVKTIDIKTLHVSCHFSLFHDFDPFLISYVSS